MRVIDMHCDTISELYALKKEGGEASILDNQLHLDLRRMKAGDYGLQNFALYINLKRTEDPFAECMGMLDTFYTEMEGQQELIGIVTSYEEIERNWEEGRMSALLTVEEGGVCRGSLALLRDFYRLGVRMMTLTWNHANELGNPNRFIIEGPEAPRFEPDTEHGLTERGIEFVREMERLGMIIDVSHLSDAGIYDVLRYTKKPFTASHSNARALASHPRNLTDDMIRAIAERGGVAGINYCAAFLRDWEDESQAVSRISDIVEHIKHFKKTGGIDCVGLGSDFDGIRCGLELKDASALPLLEAEMRRQGFTETEIEKVFYRNVMRLYKELL